MLGVGLAQALAGRALRCAQLPACFGGLQAYAEAYLALLLEELRASMQQVRVPEGIRPSSAAVLI